VAAGYANPGSKFIFALARYEAYTPPPTVTPTISPSPTPTACAIQFTDVPQTDPFYPFIRCLVCRGILSGYTTSPPCPPGATPCFNGGITVTRGQIAKIVANAAGYGDTIPSTRQTFADVPATNPFWLYVERVTLHGVISGYSTSPPCPGATPCFLPSANLTRGQMAKIDANAAGYTEAIPSIQQTFADVPTSNPFWIYVERVALHGVISGYSTSPPCPGGVPCFLPGNSVTRNQTAKIVANTFFPGCQTPVR
jgi:hypothetical protein